MVYRSIFIWNPGHYTWCMSVRTGTYRHVPTCTTSMLSYVPVRTTWKMSHDGTGRYIPVRTGTGKCPKVRTLSVLMMHFIWILATYDVVRHVRCRTSCTYDIVRVTYDIVLNIARTMSYVRYTGCRRTTSYVRHCT